MCYSNITAVLGLSLVANCQTGPAGHQPRNCLDTLPLCTVDKSFAVKGNGHQPQWPLLQGPYRSLGLSVGTSTLGEAGSSHILLRQLCGCSSAGSSVPPMALLHSWFHRLLLCTHCSTSGCACVPVCVWEGLVLPFLKSSHLRLFFNLPFQRWKCAEMLIWILPNCARLVAIRICPWCMDVEQRSSNLRPMGLIRPPRVLNPAPGIYRTSPPPPRPRRGWGGNQAAADGCLPLHPCTGPLFKKFEDPWCRRSSLQNFTWPVERLCLSMA